MRGDRVEIVIDAGGTSRTYEVTATKAGRRVEVVTGRGVVEVMEVTRGGAVVRTARFMSSRVLALVEHPANRGGGPEEAVPSARTPPRTRPGRPSRRAHAAQAGEPADAEPAGVSAAAETAAQAGATAGEPGEPTSMVEDAVDRTASQLG
jgi:hypothetical protein